MKTENLNIFVHSVASKAAPEAIQHESAISSHPQDRFPSSNPTASSQLPLGILTPTPFRGGAEACKLWRNIMSFLDQRFSMKPSLIDGFQGPVFS
jgi:hypothetical protein